MKGKGLNFQALNGPMLFAVGLAMATSGAWADDSGMNSNTSEMAIEHEHHHDAWIEDEMAPVNAAKEDSSFGPALLHKTQYFDEDNGTGLFDGGIGREVCGDDGFSEEHQRSSALDGSSFSVSVVVKVKATSDGFCERA